MSNHEEGHGLQIGDPITFVYGRPQWWNVVGWCRWLRRKWRERDGRGVYYVTHVDSNTFTLSDGNDKLDIRDGSDK